MPRNRIHPILVALIAISTLASFTANAQDAMSEASENVNHVACRMAYLIEICIGAIAALVIIFLGLRRAASDDKPEGRTLNNISHPMIGLVIVILAMPIVNALVSGILPGIECDISYDLLGKDPTTGKTAPEEQISFDPIEPSAETADPEGNKPPIAIASVGLTENPVGKKIAAVVGETVHFSALGSTDPDGTITMYTWDFGDGIVESGSTMRDTTHEYAHPRENYIATLEVTDDKNEKGSTTLNVEIEAEGGIWGGSARTSGT